MPSNSPDKPEISWYHWLAVLSGGGLVLAVIALAIAAPFALVFTWAFPFTFLEALFPGFLFGSAVIGLLGVLFDLRGWFKKRDHRRHRKERRKRLREQKMREQSRALANPTEVRR